MPSDIEITLHGCGENFPVDETTEELDSKPADGKRDQTDRRVELFFFDEELGIQPPPPGKNSSKGSLEYPEWRKRATATQDFLLEDTEAVTGVTLPSLFTRRKTFIKPSAIPILRDIATAMRDDPAKQLTIVGHADLSGSASTNDTLSLNRAKTVQAFLLGDANYFRERFRSADPVAKWEWEEVQWMLSAVQILDAPCYVGAADGYRGEETIAALQTFQIFKELEVNHTCDEATLTVLIKEYLALLGAPNPAADAITVIGAGTEAPVRPLGKLNAQEQPPDDPQGLDGDPKENPENRRVDLFLTDLPLTPDPHGVQKDQRGVAHNRWCDQVSKVIDVDPRHTIVARVIDEDGHPFANRSVTIIRNDDLAMGSATTNDRGVLKVQLPPDAYSVSISFAGQGFFAPLMVSQEERGGTLIRLPFNIRFVELPASERLSNPS